MELGPLNQLGKQVAAHLGPEWTASVETLYGWKHVAMLTKADGATLHLYIDSSPTPRVNASGAFPAGYGCDVRTITVAIAQGPERIARHIRSRFLPEYLASYAQAVEHATRSAAHEKVRQEALQRLAAIAGEPVSKSGAISLSRDWLDLTRQLEYQKSLYQVTVTLGSASRGEFRLESAPVALLERLLQVARDFGEKLEG